MEQQILDLNEKAMHAPALVVVAAFAIALGYVLTQAAFFPNKFVPLIIVLATAILFPLVQYSADFGEAKAHPETSIVFNLLLGFVAGAAAWGFHGLLLNILIIKFRAFFGMPPQPDPPPKQ